MKIQFTIPLKKMPTTHQTGMQVGINKKTDKPFLYKSKTLSADEEMISAYISRYKPEKPMEGAITLMVTWGYQKSGIASYRPKITRPDTDNLIKLLKDCMTAEGFWNDDAQVWNEHSRKIWIDLGYDFLSVVVSNDKQRN